MANLPASGYLSNAARTEAEMQTAFETLRDVVSEQASNKSLTILSGNLPVPDASFVYVVSEGGAGTDDVLNTITTSGIDTGRVVVLRNAHLTSTESASTGKITVTHGTGANAIQTRDSTNFILSGERLLVVMHIGSRWYELWRDYGRRNATEDKAAERAYLGLGDAALETVATGSGASANGKVLKVGSLANLTTNAILAIDNNGNIKAGSADGGNAATLDSLDSTDFVRSTSTTAQAMAASLTSSTTGSTRLNANTTGTAQNPGFGMQDSGTVRALLWYTQSNGFANWATLDSGGSYTPAIRLNPSNDRLEFSTGGYASWQSLRPGSGNGLDADTVDGYQGSALLNVLSIAYGASGSFRLLDGTTTLLIQWPQESDWVDGGTGAASYERWTFSTAYSAAPVIIGLSWFSHVNITNSLRALGDVVSPTITSTYVQGPRNYTVGTFNEFWRSGVPIAIGVPA